jgi:hypothetical protein
VVWVICVSCGLQLNGDLALCPHHHISSDNWAAENRIWNDYFMRGKAIPRVPISEREEPAVPLDDPSWA